MQIPGLCYRLAELYCLGVAPGICTFHKQPGWLRCTNLVRVVGRQASKWACSLCDGGRQWGQEVDTGGETMFQGHGIALQKAKGEKMETGRD